MAPRRRALSLSLGVAGVGGGDEAQTPGATVVRCYKSLPKSILWLRATLTLTFWSRSSLGTYFWAKVNKSQRGAGRWRVARALRVGDEAQTFGATVNKCPMSPS